MSNIINLNVFFVNCDKHFARPCLRFSRGLVHKQAPFTNYLKLLPKFEVSYHNFTSANAKF